MPGEKSKKNVLRLLSKLCIITSKITAPVAALKTAPSTFQNNTKLLQSKEIHIPLKKEIYSDCMQEIKGCQGLFVLCQMCLCLD